ncbi:Uncharacterised protein [Mycobacteroides abscessus subsp. abscessus]|nr:Uncharacterised protein [Mycobacteroides abscessus subsp. abscessus]
MPNRAGYPAAARRSCGRPPGGGRRSTASSSPAVASSRNAARSSSLRRRENGCVMDRSAHTVSAPGPYSGDTSRTERSRTKVPRPGSPTTMPVRFSSAYARVAVAMAIPNSAASWRCVGSRSPGAHRPAVICSAIRSATLR